MKKLVACHPLVAYLLLVLLLTWILSALLVPLNPLLVGINALVPAPAAFLVAALCEGPAGVRRLWHKSLDWGSKARWYMPAIAIPLLVSVAAVAVALALGERPAPVVATLLGLLPLTFVLAAGEEIGWQGFAMPVLRAHFDALPAALVFGAWHALFHLPMFLLPLPDELRQSSPFALYALLVVAFSVYRVWLFDRTQGNVPVAIVYHTAINTGAVLLTGVDAAVTGWVLPVVWAAAAVALLAGRGRIRVLPTAAP